MSITKIFAVAVLLLSTAACASGPTYYNPVTGDRTAIVQSGNCSPGDSRDGMSCLCEHRGDNYQNCTYQLAAHTTPRNSYWSTFGECALSASYQECVRYGNSYGYGAGPVYRCEYQGDPRCNYLPQVRWNAPRRAPVTRSEPAPGPRYVCEYQGDPRCNVMPNRP